MIGFLVFLFCELCALCALCVDSFLSLSLSLFTFLP